MAEEPLTTTTGIDALVTYLKQHGETDASTLAAELKVSGKVIEGWADVLEKANVVKISYKVGKMYISPLAVTKEGMETLKSTIEVKKSGLETDIIEQDNILQNINKKMKNFSRVLENADEIFKSNAGTLKADLDQLDSIQRNAEKYYGSIKLEKDRVDKMSETLDKEMKSLLEIASKMKNFTTGATEANKIMDDIQNKIVRSQQTMNELQVSFDKMLEEKRNSLRQEQANINEELNALKDAIEQQRRAIQENDRVEKNSKRESERIRISVEKERIALLNELEKAKLGVEQNLPLAQGKMQEITNKLEAMRRAFGDFADFNKEIKGLKDQLEEIKEMYDERMKDLALIKNEMKVINSLSVDPEKRSVAVEDISKKVSKMQKDEVNMEEKLNDVKSGVESLGEKDEV